MPLCACFTIELTVVKCESKLKKVGVGVSDESVIPRAQEQGLNADLAALSGNKAPHDNQFSFGGFIGTSPAMLHLYERIERAAKTDATIFITGESGTGKEVCAEALHKHGKRATKPFIPINCAAIPRDLMESELFGHVKGAFTGAVSDRDGAARLADGGTLFLDEIAEMAIEMQAKLLRFLQDGVFRKIGGNKPEKSDVRIVCATNRDPLEEIKQGRFREDLYYRLHVIPLAMPPLRARGEDILDIAHVLLHRYAALESKAFRNFSAETEALLLAYPWHGNIREMQNIIRHIVVMNDGDIVTVRMLPDDVQGQHPILPRRDIPVSVFQSNDNGAIRPLADMERETIESAIALCRGNIPQAAALLEISPSTIYRKKAGWDGVDPQGS